MHIVLEKKEVEQAIHRYIARDVLGICGDGWKGNIVTNIPQMFEVDVELIMPKKEDK